MASISDTVPPPVWKLALESAGLAARFYHSIGRLRVRGPADGPPLIVIPGFLASDYTTLGLQRVLARAGYRVTGWGQGLNKGVAADTLARIVARVEAFGAGRPVILVGWSLGGIFAREVAKVRPDLVAKVMTMGSPFSGDPRGNNVWRLYEWVAGHPVDDPPIDADLAQKPPVPTLALWSRRDGIVAVACARGLPGESDRQLELDCSHMGFAVSASVYPKVIAALASF